MDLRECGRAVTGTMENEENGGGSTSPTQRKKNRMKKLWSDGKVVNPVFLKGDNKAGRMYRMIRTYFSHYVKFKKYYKI